MRNTRLPPELQAAWKAIEGYAADYGLDTFPISFEVVDYRTLYEIAAYGGFPTRYPHWRWGMEFDQLIKGHTYGLSIIYELVINNNPSYAYLLEGNDIATQKMVMAHVAGHVDFFKNNFWFSHTNRHMLDAMANHAVRIGNLIDRVGHDAVENFIDVCLSLDNLIDYHAPYIRRPESQTVVPVVEEGESDVPVPVQGLPVERPYMQGYINPPDFLQEQRRRLEEEQHRSRKFPESPQRDVLLFLLMYAPLERWQRTILEIIRDEAYYFAPQMMTKILNEGWACLVAGSLLVTGAGLLRIEDIVNRRTEVAVSDGETARQIYDWASFDDQATVRVRTERGFEVEGSTTHRLMVPNGGWKRLDELAVGDSVVVAGGPQLWSSAYVPIRWQAPRRSFVAQVVDEADSMVVAVGDRSSLPVNRALAPFVAPRRGYAAALPVDHRPWLCVPRVVDENLAAVLGSFVATGRIDQRAHTITLHSDAADARRLGYLVEQVFGLPSRLFDDEDGWSVEITSRDLVALLAHLGLQPDRIGIPDAILRSPRSVVTAFLRAYADGRGAVDDDGIVLTIAERATSQTIQLVLLNLGIPSARHGVDGDGWQIRIAGTAAQRFDDEVGFGCRQKQERLRRYLEAGQPFAPEPWTDRVVSIWHGRATVYDISVTATHRYTAQGFVNHNSYWHSEIMTKKAADPSEIVDFADHHSGVVATSPGRLNPYKLGLELLRDIEDRWNKGRFGKEWEECDDLAAKRAWNRPTNQGRQKIFEVRRFHNDITFIDEFLTPEFALEQKLFTFQYNRDTDLYEVASREFAEIKRKLLYRLTNFGQPFIYVSEGNYGNRGDLYLQHRHEGVDLRVDYARDTLRNIHQIWRRPVYLETVLDDKKRLLGFDGRDYSDRRID